MNLPKSCSLTDLAKWVHVAWSDTDDLDPTDHDLARAVRALVEDRIRASLAEFGEWVPEYIEKHLDRVLGGAK